MSTTSFWTSVSRGVSSQQEALVMVCSRIPTSTMVSCLIARRNLSLPVTDCHFNKCWCKKLKTGIHHTRRPGPRSLAIRSLQVPRIVVFIARPSVLAHPNPTPADQFVVLATDGLYDFFSSQEVRALHAFFLVRLLVTVSILHRSLTRLDNIWSTSQRKEKQASHPANVRRSFHMKGDRSP